MFLRVLMLGLLAMTASAGTSLYKRAGRNLTIAVELPDGVREADQRPLVLFFHDAGDEPLPRPHAYGEQMRRLRQQGMLVGIVDYRSGPKAAEDIRDAVAYLKKNRQFGSDPAQIIYGGAEGLLAAPAGAPVGAVEETYIKTFDGTFVSGAYRVPRGQGPFPAVVMVHGGTGGGGFAAARHMLEGPVAEALLGQGFALLATDYRKYHFGEDELQDVLAAYRHCSQLPFVNPNRIALYGTSHGGYLVLLAATRIQPAAVLSLAGTADIEELFYAAAQKAKAQVTSYEQWRESLFGARRGAFNEVPLELAWRFGDNRERYREISPMAHVEAVRSPVLYLVGGEDKLRHSGKRFVEALTAKGKPALYSEHAGVGHGFYNGRGAKVPQQFHDALRVIQQFLKDQVQKPDY